MQKHQTECQPHQLPLQEVPGVVESLVLRHHRTRAEHHHQTDQRQRHGDDQQEMIHRHPLRARGLAVDHGKAKVPADLCDIVQRQFSSALPSVTPAKIAREL